MANNENLKPVRTTSEARKLGRKGGKASGEARRRKANFRKTLNMLLTAKIDSPEWTPVLEALGIDSTLESALNMAMIKEGLEGNVRAYEAIAKYSGQVDKTEHDIEEQKARTESILEKQQAEIDLIKSKVADISGDTESKIGDYLDKLQGAIKNEY